MAATARFLVIATGRYGNVLDVYPVASIARALDWIACLCTEPEEDSGLSRDVVQSAWEDASPDEALFSVSRRTIHYGIARVSDFRKPFS